MAETTTPIPAAKSNAAVHPDRYFRTLRVEAEGADEATGVLQVRFASEYPVKRKAGKGEVRMGAAKAEGEVYYEVLDHSDAANVDLSALNDGGPLLDQHRDEVQLGKVNKAALSKDKSSRAAIQFDMASELSKTRFKQMRDGSRPNVSFGYDLTKFLGDVDLGGGRVGKRFAWAADEISSVARPADPTAGSRRSRAADGSDQWACIHCGESFERDKLNEDYECGCDRGNAESGNRESGKAETGTRRFRAAGKEFSHKDLRNKVTDAVASDKRFKKKDSQGNLNSHFYVDDVRQTGAKFTAYIYGPCDDKDSQWCLHEVAFEFDGDKVTLGEAQPVKAKTVYEPITGGAGRAKAADLRFVRTDGSEISFSDLRAMVQTAAATDKRFKDGDKDVYVWVQDILQAGTQWKAIISGGKQKTYEVDFTVKETAVVLGAAVEVVAKTIYEPVTKVGRSVDSGKSSTRAQPMPAKNITISMKRNLLLDKTPTEGGGGAGGAGVQEPVKGFRVRDGGVELDLDEPVIRSAVTAAVKTLSEQKQKRAKARNEELNDIAKEFIKDHGQRVGKETVDGREELYYIGDRVRATLTECLAMDPDKFNDSEVRTILRERANDLKAKSEPPPRNVRAAILPEELASRCSFQRVLGEFTKYSPDGSKEVLRAGDLSKMNCGAEFEAHREIESRCRNVPGGAKLFENGGIHLPLNAGVGRDSRSGGRRQQRDFTAQDPAQGGALIQSQFLQIEDVLRNEMVTTQMDATFIGGCSGDVILPRGLTTTVAQSVGEGVPLLQYDQTFDQLRFTPKRVGTSQYYTRQALFQAADSTNLAAYILKDHMETIGVYQDYMAINGSGANAQPLGILNQPGIQEVIFGGTPTLSQIRTFITNIRKFNVKGKIAFVTTSVGRGRLAVLPAALVGSTVVSGQTNALWVDQPDNEADAGRLIGCMGMDSQQIPGDILLAAVWRYLLILQWGGLNVLLNPYARDDRDEWKLTLNGYMDCGLRRAQAVCRSGDSCNQ